MLKDEFNNFSICNMCKLHSNISSYTHKNIWHYPTLAPSGGLTLHIEKLKPPLKPLSHRARVELRCPAYPLRRTYAGLRVTTPRNARGDARWTQKIKLV